MIALIQAFWNIVLLRAGPQILPVSNVLLILVLLGYFLVQTLSGLNYFPFVQAVMASALDIVLLVAFLQVVLQLNGRAARFHQSLLAITGSWLLLGVLALPFILVMVDARAKNVDPGIAFWFLLGIMVWSLAVMGHVLRHALEMHLGLALVLAVLYFLVSQSLLDMLAPLPASTTG